MPQIRLPQVLKQLKNDLIGKDSYRGVTFSYSWLANQFGHYALGFIPALLIWIVLTKLTTWPCPVLLAPTIVSIAWLVFETGNFLGPLLLKKQSLAEHFYLPSKEKYTFQPAWKNVAFDTFTDLLFFWLGAFSASLCLAGIIGGDSKIARNVLLALMVVLIYPAAYWYRTKLYLQYAKFPIQFRLSQWKKHPQGEPLNDIDVQTVLSFVEVSATSSGNHLLIFGGRRSGKSTLAIGIGTELSIKGYSCSYYTAMKLFNTFALNEPEIIASDDCEVWSWRTASLLVIDDLNPGSPTPRVFLSTNDVLAAINEGDAESNRKCLAGKNVVWVLGDDDSGNPDAWLKLLLDLGVCESKIATVGLGFVFV